MTIQINAQGICPACGDIVWPEDESVKEGVRVYHAECYLRVDRRVEQLTRHNRKRRGRIIKKKAVVVANG